MFARQLLQHSTHLLARATRELQFRTTVLAADRTTRLLRWSHEKVSHHVPSAIRVSVREALTQDEIEAIARETRFYVPPLEAVKLPSFAELAAKLEQSCSCNRSQRLRRPRIEGDSSNQVHAEQVCNLVGAMNDRFGDETPYLALLERLLLQEDGSPCVRKAAANALGHSAHATTIRKRALAQLRRRVEWEGKNATQLDLIGRLSSVQDLG